MKMFTYDRISPLTNKDSTEHLEFFKNKIKNREPFSFIRPNDGEYLLMTGQSFSNIDNCTFSGGSLKDDLFASIRKMLELPNAYVGIPCKGCNEKIFNWYMDTFNIPQDKLTYGNLVCNANWQSFVSLFIDDKLPFYYIGPYKSNRQNFNLLDKFVIDERLANRWDAEKENVSQNIRRWVSDKSGIFAFSAGPWSKLMIPVLAELFPKNIYLDAGSSLDLYLKGYTNRQYAIPTDSLSKTICDFNHGHKIKLPSAGEDITAILTIYKRPQHLREQLESLASQTIRPKTIIVVRNFAEGVPNVEVPANLFKDVKYINSNTNFGVWTRFAVALLADTKYVCLFDDDTIPGNRWFENCLNSMHLREGLYGTIGIRFPSPSYSITMDHRIGWDRPNTNIEEVDIVGHAWFLKREWIHHLWNYSPTYVHDLKGGEDINLSFYLQKAGIPTLVPPHPPGCYEMYGSNPVTAWNYGMEEVAISCEPSAGSNFDICLQDAIKSGFVLMCMRNKTN
jgi:hypothetical protein